VHDAECQYLPVILKDVMLHVGRTKLNGMHILNGMLFATPAGGHRPPGGVSLEAVCGLLFCPRLDITCIHADCQLLPATYHACRWAQTARKTLYSGCVRGFPPPLLDVTCMHADCQLLPALYHTCR
jgi:hypothetical protein